MTQTSAGRAVVDLLKAEAVRHVFGIVGSTFLDVLDVLHDDRSVQYVNVRHEQGAAFMADGLARVTGAPAVCLVTSGPGATNLVTGVAGAHLAHSPVVAIAGGTPLGYQGRDAFQELDLVTLFRPVTKLSIQVTRPDRIPDVLRLAFRTAVTGRRGPVFVDIPRDVLNDQIVRADAVLPHQYRPTHPAPPHPEAVREAARRLARAERPLLLAGGGVTWAGASDLVTRLSARHGLPVVTAYGRNDAVPNDDPLYVGPLGRAGSPEAAQACRRADLLLVVGSRLGQFTSFYDARYIQPGTAIVQVDVDGRDIGRVYPVAIGIQADARETLAALLDALALERVAPASEAWREEIRELRARRQARLLAEGALDAVPAKPQRVYAELRRALPPDTIVTLDAGAAPAYGYDRLYFTRPRTFLTPLDLGGLGFALPAALGAKLGRPSAPVLAIHGDGGFLMNAQELETAVRHGIAAVALVLNNNSWGSERAYQRHFYDARYVGTDLGNPRFDRLAELFGARGYYVERPGHLGDAVREALAAGRPAVVEVPIDPDELPTPATAARRRDA
jgi:acetolactate synthase-1/2/3 large subunit/sulfoacetaldehyde acetyltransferase